MVLAMLSYQCRKTPRDGGDETSNVLSIVANNLINGNDRIVTVKAVVDLYDSWDEEVIATGKYQNNGFRITLPPVIDNKYLYLFSEEFEGENWIKISDPNAKVGGMWLSAYNNKDKEIGYFYLFGLSTRYSVDAIYLYADRNFTVTGRYEYPCGEYEEYNCSFKKGWNILYFVEENFNYNFTVTTQKPTGVDIEWIFDEDYYWESSKNGELDFYVIKEGKSKDMKLARFKNLVNKQKQIIAKHKNSAK